MTKDKLKKWLSGLKEGDVVRKVIGDDNEYVEVLRVERITKNKIYLDDKSLPINRKTGKVLNLNNMNGYIEKPSRAEYKEAKYSDKAWELHGKMSLVLYHPETTLSFVDKASKLFNAELKRLKKLDDRKSDG